MGIHSKGGAVLSRKKKDLDIENEYCTIIKSEPYEA